MQAAQTQVPDSPAAKPPAPPAVGHSRRWLKLGAAAAIALLLIAWFARNLVLGTPVPTFAVRVADLTQTVVASGRVLTPQRVAIAAQVIGRVTQVAVAEGSAVVEGQLLVELDSRDARAAVALATAALALADAQARSLREVELPAARRSLDELEANRVQADKQYARMLDLKKSGFVGQAELDNARRNLTVAQSQVGSARLQVQTRGPDGSNAAMAQAGLAQAQATLSQSTARLAQYQIRAPASGILISRAVESGDVVQPGQVLMQLAGAGHTQIEVQLDEKNLGKLKLGQTALASADAYASERFAATVAYINPGIDATRGAVAIKLDVAAPPAYLRQDMTVSVDIATAERKGVQVVPTGVIHDIAGTEAWVLVVREHHAARQVVTLGLRGDENTEVLSGVAEGEALIPVSAATVQAGAHVRAQAQP